MIANMERPGKGRGLIFFNSSRLKSARYEIRESTPTCEQGHCSNHTLLGVTTQLQHLDSFPKLFLLSNEYQCWCALIRMSSVLLYNIRFWCPDGLFGSLFIWGSVQKVPFFFSFYQASVIPPLSLGDLFIFVCSFLIFWNFQRWRNWISRGNNQRVICKQEFVTRYDRGLIHISDKAIFEIFHVDNIHHFNLLQNAPH